MMSQQPGLIHQNQMETDMLSHFAHPLLIGLIIYVSLQIIIAIVSTKYIKTSDDFFVAGRNLSWFPVTISVFATWFGAETCISAAGQIYSEGITQATVEPFAYALCLIFAGIFFVGKFWDRNIITLSDFFRQRFSSKAEKISAMILIPPSLFWASAQIRAFGHIISTFIPIEIETSITIATAIVIGYTVIGGLLADVYTDIFQAFILLAGLLVLSISVFLTGDNDQTITMNDIFSRFHFFSNDTLSFLETIEIWSIPICGSIVAQEVLQRTVAAKSRNIATNGTVFGGILYLIVGLIPVILGLYGPFILPNISDNEQFLPILAQNKLSPLFSIIFIGAIISAILSTVDSSLLASSSLLIRNIFPYDKLDSEKKNLVFARTGVIIFGLLSWWLANRAESVFSLVEDASSFGSSGIFVTVIFGLFTSQGQGLSAIFSLLAGIIVWIIGDYFLNFSYPYLLSLTAALSGFYIGMIIEKYYQHPAKVK